MNDTIACTILLVLCFASSLCYVFIFTSFRRKLRTIANSVRKQ